METNRPPRSVADGAFAVAMVCVGAFVIWGLRNQPKAPFDPVGAAAVPFWTAVLMIVLAGSLLIRVLLGRSTTGTATSYFVSTDAIDDSYEVRPGFSLAAMFASFAYAAAMPFLGFAIASAGFMLFLGWQLSDRSPRALATVAAIAIIGGFGVDAGFRAMMIDLP